MFILYIQMNEVLQHIAAWKKYESFLKGLELNQKSKNMCKKSVNFLDINIATTRELPITQNVKND